MLSHNTDGRPAVIAAAERPVQAIAQLAERGRPALDYRSRNTSGQICRRSTGADGIGENVQKRRLDPFQKVVGPGEVVVRLPGKADDHVVPRKASGMARLTAPILSANFVVL